MKFHNWHPRVLVTKNPSALNRKCHDWKCMLIENAIAECESDDGIWRGNTDCTQSSRIHHATCDGDLKHERLCGKTVQVYLLQKS